MGDTPDEKVDSLPQNIERRIISKIPALKQLSDSERKELFKEIFSNCSSASVEVHKTFFGPLPPPETLEDYNRVVPGLAERIISMTERQQEHRMTLEKTVVGSQQKQSNRGQLFAFILTILLISCGFFLSYTGHTAAGVTIFSTTIIGVAATFIANQVKQVSELRRKKKLVPEKE